MVDYLRGPPRIGVAPDSENRITRSFQPSHIRREMINHISDLSSHLYDLQIRYPVIS